MEVEVATQWHFEELEGRYLYSKSTRQDYLAALSQHVETHGAVWATTPSAFDDTNVPVDTDNDQVNKFVDYLASYFVSGGDLPILLRGSIDGRYFLLEYNSYSKLLTPPDFAKPYFVVQPESDLAIVDGAEVFIEAEARFNESYQWYKDGVAVVNVTGDSKTLIIDAFGAADEGSYLLRAYNQYGYTDSEVAIFELV